MPENKTLGRYEIVKEIGRGGMGIVMQGRDPMIDRLVALKIIKIDEVSGSMNEVELRQRFYIEAKAAGKLAHPNIVTIYDVGEEGGKSFMAMEYIDGRDLSDLITKNRPLPLARAAIIISQIANGLAYAHEQGIVHRDIKPGNILVMKRDHIKITDFGLARLQTSGSVTQTGHTVGSPSYISPEQVQGKNIDGRSDQFSLGVLFYELVTGKRPFEGEGITTVIFKIIKDNPDPPSALQKNLPKTIDKIIGKMLSKKPEERFDNLRDVMNALRPFTGKGAPLKPEMTTLNFNRVDAAVDFDSGTVLKESRGGGMKTAILTTILFLGAVGAWMFYGDKVDLKKLPFLNLGEIASSPTPETDEEKPDGKKETPIIKPAILSISSDVPGEVFIDGKLVGKTPVKGLGLTPGDKVVVVKAKGYKPWEQKVTLASGTMESTKATLKLVNGATKITSSPSGATVTIDGRQMGGKTPLVIPGLKLAEHSVKFSKTGYLSASKKMTVKSSKVNLLSATLLKLDSQLIVSAPKGATVYLGKSRIGTVPLKEKILSGKHKVTLAQSGYYTKVVKIDAKKGGSVTISEKLAPTGKGSIRFTAIPWADIYINGRKVGATPRLVKKVDAGKVKVSLKNPGYKTYRATVNLRKNGTETVFHRFKESEAVSTRSSTSRKGGDVGSLLVTSKPTGIVFVDGKHYGKTPVEIKKLSEGEHLVIIKRAGKPDYKRKITVAGGIVTRLPVE